MARLIVRVDDLTPRQLEPGESTTWTVDTYPTVKPKDERPTKVADDRMLWRSDHTVAYAKGRRYPIEEHDLLISQTEVDRLGREAAQPETEEELPPPPRKPRRTQ